MHNQEKRPSKALWLLVVIVAIVLGFVSSVVTVGTLVHFEQKKAILADKNTEVDKSLKAEEQLLFDDNGVKATFLGFNKSKSPFGNTINFEVENKSDREIKFYFDYLKVNGLVVDATMHERIAKGQKMKVEATLKSLLHEIKIEKIEELDFQLIVYNGDYVPYGEYHVRTNHYGKTDRETPYRNKLQVVNESVENGQIVISLLPDLTVSGNGKEKYYVMIENNTDSPLEIDAEGMIYNGTTVKEGTFRPERLPAHSKSVEPVEMNLPKDITDNLGTMQSFEILLDIKGTKEVGYLYVLENVKMKIK